MVAGFGGAAWTATEPRAHAASMAAAHVNCETGRVMDWPVAAAAIRTASKALNRAVAVGAAAHWTARSTCDHKSMPARSAPGPGKSRYAASDLRVRESQVLAGIDSAFPIHRQGVDASHRFSPAAL